MSNVGKWDRWYRSMPSAAPENIGLYGDATTYLMAASFLADVAEVEDWGCGRGGFRKFCVSRYVGVDGSKTPFADKAADLCNYQTNVDGIMLRHVLEHNYEWEKILQSAVRSFGKKLCLILFTPFADTTREINHNRNAGVDAPDLSFTRPDIEAHFSGLSWRLIENIKTDSQYGVEHVYLVWRGPENAH